MLTALLLICLHSPFWAQGTTDATPTGDSAKVKMESKVDTLPAKPAQPAPKPEPETGEGFIVEESGKGHDGKKVKKLVDDPGKGEQVPRMMVEGTLSMQGLDNASVQTGVGAEGAFFYRPTGEWWIGAQAGTGYTPGDTSTLTFRGGIAGRYYFMPHREANRFVMAYLHLEAGFMSLAKEDDDVSVSVSGPYASLGVGVAKALSTKTYLGLAFKYTIPFWTELCTDASGAEVCGSDTADFNPRAWQFGVYLSTSF